MKGADTARSRVCVFASGPCTCGPLFTSRAGAERAPAPRARACVRAPAPRQGAPLESSPSASSPFKAVGRPPSGGKQSRMSESAVKREPMSESTVKREPAFESASVPIPARRTPDFSFELELCAQESNMYQSLDQTSLYGRIGDHFRMDDDDIFQVDKADLIQGPTLAELNANDDTLLEDLNFDDLVLPEDNDYYLQIGDSMAALRSAAPSLEIHPPAMAHPSPVHFGGSSSPVDAFGRNLGGAFSPGSAHSSQASSLHDSQRSSPRPGLQELLATVNRPPPSIPTASPLQRHVAAARLSSSAPTHLSLEQIWQRREPRKHLLSTGSLAEAGSTSSLSTGGVLSPGAHEDLSQDEDSDEDSDRYEDFSSDADSDNEDESKAQRKKPNPKGERYFWQYNIQAKGPKGQRLVLKTKLEDPHVLNEVTDPVFSPSCSLRGIKHSGKARKGDGNDLTPNPKKLYNIGKELDNLGKIINDMTPVSELPFNVRPKTRKEKNKLASRACRLKKKAQHEANKLKLYGLQQEHRQLMYGISQMKHLIVKKCMENNGQIDLNMQVDKIVKGATTSLSEDIEDRKILGVSTRRCRTRSLQEVKIAGHSSEFVNRILDKIKAGVPDGGLNDM